MVQRVFHISDIHIRPESTDNIRHAFTAFIKHILSYGAAESIVVIAGDVFENKSHVTSDDIYVFIWMMELLKKHKIHTLIVPGNHDYNINSKFAKDSISVLVRGFSPLIRCVNQSDVVTIDNIDFYIFSPVDKEIPALRENSQQIKIAVLHEPVAGSTYDNGNSIMDARFNRDSFPYFDYVMLGDIHKPQFLVLDRIAYSGSFVQKTKAEGLDHGYILWDLVEKTGRHVFIPLKEVYLTVEAINDECHVPYLLPEQHVRHLTLQYTNCTHAALTQITNCLRSRFGHVNRIVDKTTYKPLDKITLPNLEVSHNDLLRQMLQSHTPEFIEKVIQYHNTRLQNAGDVHHTQYRLNYLVWDNILCYGTNNYIDFRNFNNSIVLLNGKNKFGKSSIIDILHAVLFNTVTRGHVDDIVNKTKKEAYIKLSLNVGDDEYIIEQRVNRMRKRKTHRLYKNGVNITKDNINQTYEWIRRNITGNHAEFVNMTTALQNRVPLTDDKKLHEYLSDISDVGALSIVEEQLKKEHRTLKALHKDTKAELDSIQQLTKHIKPVELQNSVNEYKRQLTAIVSEINSSNDTLKTLHHEFNPTDIPQDIDELVQQYQSKVGSFTPSDTVGKRKTYKESMLRIAVLEEKINVIDAEPCNITHEISEIDYLSYVEKVNDLQRLVTYPVSDVSSTISEEEMETYLATHTSTSIDELKVQLKVPTVEIFDRPLPVNAEISYDKCLAELSLPIPDYNAISNRKSQLELLINSREENITTSDMQTFVDSHTVSDADYKQLQDASTEITVCPNPPDDLESYDNYLNEIKTITLPDYERIRNDVAILTRDISETTSETAEEMQSFVDQWRDTRLAENEIMLRSRLLNAKIEIVNRPTEMDYSLYDQYTYYLKSRPDYSVIINNIATIEGKIKSFEAKYQTLSFDKGCKCCMNNQSVLRGLNNIDALQSELNELQLQLKDRNQVEAACEKYVQYLKDVDEHKALTHDYDLWQQIREIKVTNQKLSNFKLILQRAPLLDVLSTQESTVSRRKFITERIAIISAYLQQSHDYPIWQKINEIKDVNAKIQLYTRLIEYRELEESLNGKPALLARRKRCEEIINATKRYDRDIHDWSLWEKIRMGTSINNNLELYSAALNNIRYKRLRELIGLCNEYQWDKKSTLQQELDEKRKIVAECNVYLTTLADYNKYMEFIELCQIKQHNDKIAPQIQQLEVRVRELEYERETLTETTVLLEKQLSAYESNLVIEEKLKTKFAGLDEEKTLMDAYSLCLSSKKGITTYMLKNLCTAMEQTCNSILVNIADFEIRVQYDPPSTSGGKADSVKVFTYESGTTIPAAVASGYQKFVMDMVLRIALNKLSTLSSPGVIFIDEGFGALDKDNFIAISRVMKSFRQYFSTIFIITHIEEMKAYSDIIVDIVRLSDSKLTWGNLSSDELTFLVKTEMDDDELNAKEFNTLAKQPIMTPSLTLNFSASVAESKSDVSEEIMIERKENGDFYCKACKKEFSKRTSIDKHLNGKSYRTKHDMYTASILRSSNQ